MFWACLGCFVAFGVCFGGFWALLGVFGDLGGSFGGPWACLGSCFGSLGGLLVASLGVAAAAAFGAAAATFFLGCLRGTWGVFGVLFGRVLGFRGCVGCVWGVFGVLVAALCHFGLLGGMGILGAPWSPWGFPKAHRGSR